MTNFLKETSLKIIQSGQTHESVTFIGSRDGEYGFTFWSDFEKLADFSYDSGYGGQHIAQDLIVVFEDGSEWWSYNETPKVPTDFKPIILLQTDDSWHSVSEHQDPDA